MNSEEKEIKQYRKSCWKKGQSGNPKGKPKGKSKFTTLKEAFLGLLERTNGTDGMMRWIYEPEVIRDYDGKVLELKDHSAERWGMMYRILGSMTPKEMEISGKDGQPFMSAPPVYNFIKVGGKEINGNTNRGIDTGIIDNPGTNTSGYINGGRGEVLEHLGETKTL